MPREQEAAFRSERSSDRNMSSFRRRQRGDRKDTFTEVSIERDATVQI